MSIFSKRLVIGDFRPSRLKHLLNLWKV